MFLKLTRSGHNSWQKFLCSWNLNLILFLILIFILVQSSHSRANGVNNTQYLSPVILVPGDGGCQIDAKWKKQSVIHILCTRVQKTWTTLWLAVSDLSPYIIDCFTDNMRLVYSNISRTSQNSPGVETRIPGFGQTYSVEYLDPFIGTHWFLGYFDKVDAKLVEIGYKRNKTIKGAPYDFRKAPNELGDYFTNLTKLIEDSFQEHNQKVTLVAHSMGAPVLRYFFSKKSQKWKDTYIQSVISLAGAWGGSVKPVKVYAVGDNLGHWVLSTLSVRLLQVSFPSLAFLMPSQELWAPDEVLVQTPKRNYSLSNIKEFFDALKLPDGFDMYQDTKDLLYKIPPPGVEVHCLYGLRVPTTNSLLYKKSQDFPSYPVLQQGDGDGTVNKRSAEFCLKWAKEQKQKVYHKSFDKVDHIGILSEASVLDYISKYLLSVSLRNAKKKV